MTNSAAPPEGRRSRSSSIGALSDAPPAESRRKTSVDLTGRLGSGIPRRPSLPVRPALKAATTDAIDEREREWQQHRRRKQDAESSTRRHDISTGDRFVPRQDFPPPSELFKAMRKR